MFELRRCRVTNFTSSIESESSWETVAKNRTEFQWGSKLQGTSSEALIWPNAAIIQRNLCMNYFTVCLPRNNLNACMIYVHARKATHTEQKCLVRGYNNSLSMCDDKMATMADFPF